MFETALLTLVGAEKIPHDFTGDNIFKKIRNKFNNAISNEKKKGPLIGARKMTCNSKFLDIEIAYTLNIDLI